MNIKNQKRIDNQEPYINEQQSQKIKEQQQIEQIYSSKSQNIEFSCGAIMGSFNNHTNAKIGLNYHANTTSTFEEFIESINNFLSVTSCKLTSSDINKLKVLYYERKK